MKFLTLVLVILSGFAACNKDSEEPVPGLPLESQTTCMLGDACTATTSGETRTFANYRKDYFLSYEKYPEADIPDPINGGRMQIAGVAQASGPVTTIEINGEDSTALNDRLWLHWIHIWPRTLVKGEPFWVNFHSHEPIFDQVENMSLVVKTEQGTALDDRFPIYPSKLPLSYVTTVDDGQQMLIHLKNLDGRAHRLKRLLVNNLDVTEQACIANREIASQEQVMWTVPLCASAKLGAAWTVVAEFEDTLPSVGAGRFVPEHFPIHTWPQSVDCPFPGGNQENFQRHLDAGFDTFFTMKRSYDYPGTCEVDTSDIVTASEANDDVWLMVERHTDIPKVAKKIVRLVGDESDQVIEDRPKEKADFSKQFWMENPEVATYLGGSRNRHTAAFAGTTDFQGIDVYFAACAPHVTDYNSHPPVDSIYDFTDVTRRNHMPLPTWVYSQGFSVVWNTDAKNFQPNPAEAMISTASVLAGGAKGLMYFQSNLEMADLFADTWAGIISINQDVLLIRDWLREGDPLDGYARSENDVMLRAIRARDVIVIVVINKKAVKEASDLGCLTEATREVLDPDSLDPEAAASSHEWIMDEQTVALKLDVPADIALSRVREVIGGAFQAWPKTVSRNQRTLTLSEIALSHERPYRILVLDNNVE